jgi:hypothetical protein
MSEPREVWACRDNRSSVLYLLDKKPFWHRASASWEHKESFGHFWPSCFKGMTGIDIQPGEAVQLRLSVEVIRRLKGGEG